MKTHKVIKRLELISEEPNKLELTLSYIKGGINYFTGSIERRGYYIIVSPVTVKNNFVSFTAFQGVKKLIQETSRFSQKTFNQLLESIENDHSEYQNIIDHVLNKNNLTLKSSIPENDVNLCSKSRDKEDPYEIWVGFHPEIGKIEYRVLKKYQKPSLEAKNKFARWFVAAKSEATYGNWELGDTYIKDIKAIAQRVQ